MIVIHEQGYTTIQVVEGNNKIEDFKVSKSVLCDQSPVFKAMFLPFNFKESQFDAITLKEDRVLTMEILFKGIFTINTIFIESKNS